MVDWAKTRHFKNGAVEFRCRCGCGRNEMDDQFIAMLDELRDICGFPFNISSGFRCPSHNRKVSSTGDKGPHTTGHAADILVDRGRAVIVLRYALLQGFTGIGVKQKGSGRFIHLDDLPDAPNQPRPTIWSY